MKIGKIKPMLLCPYCEKTWNFNQSRPVITLREHILSGECVYCVDDTGEIKEAEE